MRATTKRKPLLDLESELQGDRDDAGSRPKLRRASAVDTGHKSGESAAPKKHDPPPEKKKKEKEFAWMDSDAEGSDSESEGVKKRKKYDDPVGLFEETRSSNKARSRSRSSSEGGPPLPASVTEVQTFSQMVRMSEGLKKRVRSMGCTELVQCLAAASRVKFFDGSFFQDMLIPQIQRQLSNSRKKSPFTTEDSYHFVFIGRSQLL